MKNGRAASIEVEDLSSGRGKDKMVFHARKAVILTAGGFAANPELVESYRADLAGIPTDNNPGSTGEVMLEAIRLVPLRTRSNAFSACRAPLKDGASR